MTEKEAIAIVERLKNGCVYHRFNEPGVYAEYIRALMRFQNKYMSAAIDTLLETDSKNVPAISDLSKAYRAKTKELVARQEVRNEEYCEVCDDRGIIIITKIIKVGKDEIPYQYVYHCPYCAKGQSWAYDGRNCTKETNRSEFCIPPVTSILTEQEIREFREKNREKAYQKQERKAIQMENIVESVCKGF